jgi:hypothetical protein
MKIINEDGTEQKFETFPCTACGHEHGLFNSYRFQYPLYRLAEEHKLCMIAETPEGIAPPSCNCPVPEVEDEPEGDAQDCGEPAYALLEVTVIDGEPYPTYGCEKHFNEYAPQLDAELDTP